MPRFRRTPSQKAAAAERRKRRQQQALEGGMQVKAIVGRAVIVFLLLFACVVPVIFLASPISYIPLIAVVLLIIASFVYLLVLQHFISYSEESLLGSCERGADIEFVVRFKNSSVLPVLRLEPYFYISDLFGEVDTAIPASMVLMPFEERDFRFAASFDHIGTYSAGVRKLVIGDLLGLFQRTRINPNRHKVEVLPKIFDVGQVDLSNVSVQETRRAIQAIITDDMDYAGVRDYATGDPLKTVHWNLSARLPAGQLLTRLFETQGNPGVEIYIDTSSPKYDHESLMQVFDGVVESALSLAMHSHEMGIDATLIYEDRNGETCRSTVVAVEDSMSLINSLPAISVGDGREALDLLQRQNNSIFGEGNVAFCTAQLNDEVVSQLLEIKMHKRNPLLFAVIPKTLGKQEQKDLLAPLRRLEMSQVSYYVVSDAAQINKEEG